MTESAFTVPVRRAAIFGVGLLGGSLGMAWRRAGVAAEVVGVGRDEARLQQALELGAVDAYTTDPFEGLRGADLVVLAGPVSTILAWAKTLAPVVEPASIVTDVGSTKARVVRAWEGRIAPGAHFVGGHPMAGSEKAGVTAARPDLFQDARWILTPTTFTQAGPLALVRSLAEAAGARVLEMSPEDHDSRVAFISHLPQAVASALAAAVGSADDRLQDVIRLAGGGFRDTTRIAASPANIWLDIFATNRESVLAALRSFKGELDALEAAIRDGDAARIEAIFRRANAARSKL